MAIGSLFRVGAQGQRTVHAGNLIIPNTLCWSPDGQTLYFGDSTANTLWRYPFHTDGTLGERQTFYTHNGQGRIDGSAIDADGCLWTCLNGGGALLHLAPDGTLLRTVTLPVSQPATCQFGGADLNTLYLTSARDGLSTLAITVHEPAAGALLALPVDVPGLPPHRFTMA